MHAVLVEKRDEIIAACVRLHVGRLDVFGSAARGADFDPGRSDADFLVDFEPGTTPGPYLDLKETFECILGRSVDLVERRALQTSRNHIRRRHILSQVESIYVA